MQINHAGSATSKDIIGTVPVAPSVVSNPVKNSVPRELTKEEIGGIVGPLLLLPAGSRKPVLTESRFTPSTAISSTSFSPP